MRNEEEFSTREIRPDPSLLHQSRNKDRIPHVVKVDEENNYKKNSLDSTEELEIEVDTATDPENIYTPELIKKQDQEIINHLHKKACEILFYYEDGTKKDGTPLYKIASGIIQTVDIKNNEVMIGITDEDVIMDAAKRIKSHESSSNILVKKINLNELASQQVERIERMEKEKYGVIVMINDKPKIGYITSFDELFDSVTVEYENGKTKTVDMASFIGWQNDTNHAKIRTTHRHEYKQYGTPREIAQAQNEVNKHQEEINKSTPVSKQIASKITEKIHYFTTIGLDKKEGQGKIKFDSTNIDENASVIVDEYGTAGYVNVLSDNNKMVLLNIPTKRSYITPNGETKYEPTFKICYESAEKFANWNWPDEMTDRNLRKNEKPQIQT